ncbi:MAG: GFA family protein [Thalassolituus oleivorans]|uniref:GFA family protein n=1 Tax=Thalassolituus oleivorans TaxID=187493 RepID=UPI001B62562E|nr:GFA family protein [Thalassolituus oleivorans]MBQ0725960.1 GFA family protein [Thalassolituus oleivorans]
MHYSGSCHCGAIKYEFESNVIDSGLRCNCSMCRKKGALMSVLTVPVDELTLDVKDDALTTYTFNSHHVKHHFCKVCGIYTFHKSKVTGGYRLNLGCIDNLDTDNLPFTFFNGANLPSITES